MEKLTIFLLLTILLSISCGQISGDPIPATTLSDELNGDVTVSDNEINTDETTTNSGNGESLITAGTTEEETTSANENALNEEEQTSEPNKSIDEEQTAEPNKTADDEQATEANEVVNAEQANEPNNAGDEEHTAENNNVVDEEQAAKPNKPVNEEAATEANKTEGEQQDTEPNKAEGEEAATEPNKVVAEEQATEPNRAEGEEQATEPNKTVDEEQATEPNRAEGEEQATEPNKAVDEEQNTEPNKAEGEEQPTEPNITVDEEQATETNKAASEEPATEPNEEVDTTKKVEAPTTTASPPPICTTTGVQANQNDCQQYFECTTVGSADGSLHAVAKPCPQKMAFSPALNRCSRDIAACPLDIQCITTGAISDPAGNSSYYYCQKYYEGTGFFIFHVDCESYKYYEPLAGKCVIDMSSLTAPSAFPPIMWNKAKDDEIVKDELKLIQKEYKMKTKAEEKLEKDKGKKAKKQAKLEEKLRKTQIKQEAAVFVCVEEGKFPSQFADNVYIQCITKKTKLKAMSMQCMLGTSFNSEIGSCIGSMADSNSLSSDDED